MLEFHRVTARAKANVYFGGDVVSHSIVLESGETKTLGLIRPGSYHFGTDASERMDIIDGACRVMLDGEAESLVYASGSHFVVPCKSGFTITVESGLAQYVCSFLKS